MRKAARAAIAFAFVGLVLGAMPTCALSSGSLLTVITAAPKPPATSQADPIPAALRTQANSYVDPYIDQALAAIAADPRDDLSLVVQPFTSPNAYSRLTPNQQSIYIAMQKAITALQPAQFLNSDWANADTDGKAAYKALVADNPGFGIYSRTYLVESTAGDIRGIAIQYYLPYDQSVVMPTPQQIQEAIDYLEAVVQRITSRMPTTLSTYDKYRYLAVVESMLLSYDYTHAAGMADTTIWAIMAGKTICDGYSITYCYLCQRAGLWCRVVIGKVETDSQSTIHAWNLVQLDTGTYYVDVTWADGMSPDNVNSPSWFRYFMMDEATMSIDHATSDGTAATGSAEALQR